MKITTFLEKPVFPSRAVLGFSGWPDAGRIVEYTLSELKNAFPHEPFADWDLDGFWHAESTRPRITVEHGQIQEVKWPVYHFWLLTPPSSPPFLIGGGPEPTIHWRAFVDGLVQLLGEWGCREIVLLGGLYDQILHDDIMVSGVGQGTRAYNQLHALKCHQTQYTGPGAIHSAIMTAAHESHLHCLAFWAHYPFYLSGRHEALMARVIEILASVLGLSIETEHLSLRWERRLKEIEDIVQQNDDLLEVLESLKKGQPPKSFFGESSKVVRLDEFLKKREGPHFNKD
jgi:hypothetical protein